MIYSILFLVIAAFIIDMFSQKYILNNVNYKREISKTVVEIGEDFNISTIVENKKILPVMFLRIEEKLPRNFQYKFKTNVMEADEGLFHVVNMSIMPFQRIRRTYNLTCNSRGRYLLHEIIISAGDFLGFNMHTKTIYHSNDIIVLPERCDFENNYMVYGETNGDISVKRWIIEDPVLTVGIREYTGSEPQKTIHWPSSLRTGRLMVKRFDYTTDNSVLIMLNVECYKPFWYKTDGEKIEKSISVVRTLVEQLEEQGIPYGLITNAQVSGTSDAYDFSFTGLGNNHMRNILEDLGRMGYSITSGFEENLRSVVNGNINHSTYIIVTPYLLEEYVEYVNYLGSKCQRLIVVSHDMVNINRLNDSIIPIIERSDSV